LECLVIMSHCPKQFLALFASRTSCSLEKVSRLQPIKCVPCETKQNFTGLPERFFKLAMKVTLIDCYKSDSKPG